jgi:enoyl-CoA hydratase/carnithine racemase
MGEAVSNAGFVSERRDGVALWTIDRPQARNAIDEGVVNGLSAALDAAEQDPSLRAVVLTGSGDTVFVSGADLKFLRDAAPERRAHNDTRMLAQMERLAALPVPVIAALNGVVIGGGTEVAFACDLRVAEPHTTITMKHAALGISPGWGGLTRLTALVGRSVAAKLLFTALPIGAEEALRVGLLDEIVPKGQARARALELAAAVAEVSPSTVAELKALLWRAYAEDGASVRAAERELFVGRTVSEDHREALAALFEKRKPAYRKRGEG